MTKKGQDTVIVAKITAIGTIGVAIISLLGNLVLGYWQFSSKDLSKNNLNTCDKLLPRTYRDKHNGEEKTKAS